jgi:hypothetical protein
MYRNTMSRNFVLLYGGRRLQKDMTFCACYGGDPAAVARRAGLLPAEAVRVVAEWRAAYPEVAKTLDSKQLDSKQLAGK